MKRKLPYIILGLCLLMITSLIVFIIVTKQDVRKNKSGFNYEIGETLKFPDFETEVEILNIASNICPENETCFYESEVEMSVKVTYNNEQTFYTLKTYKNPLIRIENSNNYLYITNIDEKLELVIKDRKDL